MAAAFGMAALAGGCAHRHDAMMGGMPGMSGARPSVVAVAELSPTAGQTARGTLTLMAHGDHLMGHAKLSGLKPGQEHGFHLHEKGDCSAPDGSSAGGHFNPHGAPHGPQNSAHHAGDLPSLKADAQGNAELRFPLTGVGVGSGADVLGRGVIVHAQADDFSTQPTGNSGARIACGVITKK